MACSDCRDHRFMWRAVVVAHLIGGLLYVFVRLHSLGVIR